MLIKNCFSENALNIEDLLSFQFIKEDSLNIVMNLNIT